MITYKIYFTHKDRTEDSVIIQAETLEEIRELRDRKLEELIGLNPWTVEVV